MGRRMARIVALQVLHEVDAVSHSPDLVLARRVQEESLSRPAADFALSLVDGVVENREEIERTVARFAPDWPVGQIGAVERSILSLAIFEMTLAGQTPPKVAINEAVELAKAFGSDSSPRFVNGVLGSVLEAHTLARSDKIPTSNTTEVA